MRRRVVIDPDETGPRPKDRVSFQPRWKKCAHCHKQFFSEIVEQSFCTRRCKRRANDVARRTRILNAEEVWMSWKERQYAKREDG